MCEAQESVERDAIVVALSDSLTSRGLDLIQAFSLRSYNDVVNGQDTIPDFGRGDAFAVLIGNTRALWQKFIEALKMEPDRLESRHPLDVYVKTVVTEALGELTCDVNWFVRWAHEHPSVGFAAQLMAEVSGMAARSPGHLSVHDTYGPWIAIRAVVIFDREGGVVEPATLRCEGCLGGCTPAVAKALGDQNSPTAVDGVLRNWRRWLEVRSACPAGVMHRYSESQIIYHYTHDKELLIEAVKALII